MAKPNPKMGQALGPLGINMMQFCKDFNAKTAHIRQDIPLRVALIAMTDRSYTYKLQGPPTSWLLKKVLGIQKFTSMPRHKWTNYLSAGYVYEIAKIKQEMDEDLKKQSLESVCKAIVAQCRGMGVLITLEDPQTVDPTSIKVKL